MPPDWKRRFHRLFDPLIARRADREARRVLRALPDGEYRADPNFPYVPQFTSPERIVDYIHHGYTGLDDPQQATFGAPTPEDYAFWSRRVCALAVIKMAVAGYQSAPAPSLWELTEQGLAMDGYRMEDERGQMVDEGWYFAAQVELARRYGLHLGGYSYVSPLALCAWIYRGFPVAATVTPDIGEREDLTGRYGGHVVLVYGFGWQNGQPTYFLLHNPSGRYPELQAEARIPYARFRESYAYRFAVFQPL